MTFTARQNPPITGPSYMEISYPRLIGALDLTYMLEVSDELGTWSSAAGNFEAVSTIANGDGVTQTITVRLLPAFAGAPKKFARVRVTVQ